MHRYNTPRSLTFILDTNGYPVPRSVLIGSQVDSAIIAVESGMTNDLWIEATESFFFIYWNTWLGLLCALLNVACWVWLAYTQ